MPCCGWPSVDVSGDPAFPLIPPICGSCVLCASPVGSTPPKSQPFFSLPAMREPPFGKALRSIRPQQVQPVLKSHPHPPTWQFSLSSRQILAKGLEMLWASVFVLRAEARTQPSALYFGSKWKPPCLVFCISEDTQHGRGMACPWNVLVTFLSLCRYVHPLSRTCQLECSHPYQEVAPFTGLWWGRSESIEEIWSWDWGTDKGNVCGFLLTLCLPGF